MAETQSRRRCGPNSNSNSHFSSRFDRIYYTDDDCHYLFYIWWISSYQSLPLSKSEEKFEEDEGEPVSKVMDEIDPRFRGCNPKGHLPSSTCSQTS